MISLGNVSQDQAAAMAPPCAEISSEVEESRAKPQGTSGDSKSLATTSANLHFQSV